MKVFLLAAIALSRAMRFVELIGRENREVVDVARRRSDGAATAWRVNPRQIDNEIELNMIPLSIRLWNRL